MLLKLRKQKIHVNFGLGKLIYMYILRKMFLGLVMSVEEKFRVPLRVSYCYRDTDLLSLHCLVLGIRLFDEGIKSTDATESVALVHKLESIDIYSNSWGPGDMGWRVEGPGPLTRKALELGSKKVLYQIIKTLTHSFI